MGLEETNENKGHPQVSFASAKNKKKILADRNADNPPLNPKTPQEKPAMGFSRIHSISDSSPSAAYDPVNNYTSPRPAFLRYNPDRRKEILLRMKDEEGSPVDSGISQSLQIDDDLFSISSTSQDKEVQEDVLVEKFEEEEVEKRKGWCFGMVWKLVLLLGVLLFLRHCLFTINLYSRPMEQRVSNTKNLLHGSTLKTHLGLSDLCLDVGEGMCGIDLAKNESLMFDGVCGDLMDEDSVQNAEELVIEQEREETGSSNEVSEVLDSDEKSSVEDLMDGATIQNDEELVIVSSYEVNEVMDADVNNSTEVLVDGDNIQIAEELLIEEREQTDSFYDSIEQEETLGSESFEALIVEAEDESVELAESLLAPQFQYASISLPIEQAAEVSEIPAAAETSSKWKIGVEYDLKDLQLVLLSLSFLAAVIGILFGLFKYFRTAHQEPIRASSPSPKFASSAKSVYESKVVIEDLNVNKHSFLLADSNPGVSVMEELRAESKNSSVNPLHPIYSKDDEFQHFYATRSPVVELLGEFSIADGLASKASSGRTLKSKGYEEPKVTKSQARKASDDCRISQIENGRTVSKSASPFYEVHSNLAMKSPANGSYAAKENLKKKEESIEKGERKKVLTTPTPLRRSSRLRNQVSSPTP